MTSTEIIVLPKELRIEKKLSDSLRSGIGTWLPVALLAPFAFMAEVVPAAIGILLILGFTIREFRRSSTDIMPILELADRGELEEATFQLATMAKKERDWHRKSFLVALLSSLELRNGNPTNARLLASESVRHTLSKQPILTRSLAANLAMILALDGETEEALRLLPTSPTPDPVTDSYRMVVWARAEQWEQVVSYKFKALPQMRGFRHHNRLLALMKALALSHSHGGELKVQRYLDEARPNNANEYQYLCTHWPKLADFIKAHPQLDAPRNILKRSF